MTAIRYLAIAALLATFASCTNARRVSGPWATSAPAVAPIEQVDYQTPADLSPGNPAAHESEGDGGKNRPVTHSNSRNHINNRQPKKPWDDDADPRDFPALTLSDAVGIALANNPTLAQAAAAMRRTEAQGAQVGFYPNPTAGYVASNIGDDHTAGEHGLFLSQTLVTAGKLELNRAVAAGDLAAAQAIYQAQQIRVTADVRALFYRALAAQHQVDAARRLEDIADEGLEITERRYEAGKTSRGDLLQARVVLDRAIIGAARAGIEANAAWRRLAAAMASPQLAPMRLEGDLGPPPNATDLDQIDFESLWYHVHAISPELQAARARVTRAAARIAREQAEAVPNIELQGQIQHDFANNQALGGLQIGIPVPIRHRNQGAIAAAQAEYQRADADFRRLELALREGLAEAVGRAATAGRRVESYRDEIVPQARESLELIQQLFDDGETDLLRLLTAQQSYASAVLDLIQFQVDWQLAWAAIDGLLLDGALAAPPDPPSPGYGPGLHGVPRVE